MPSLNPVLESLRLVDFRCFPSASYHFESEVTFFVGQNAQGKTSLLEALAVGCRLQSPRASRQSQMVRLGRTGCGISLTAEDQHFKAVYQDQHFSLSHNGQAIKRKDYLKAAPRMVWMENRDMDLIRGSAERRRRYLDGLGSQFSADYGRALRSYTRALRSRNNLLKDRQSGSRQFAAFSEQLLVYGKSLITMRQELGRALAPLVASQYQHISAQRGTAQIAYQPSCEASHFEAALQQSASQEALMKQTLIGPHRDELAVELDAHPASEFGSEGQQRTLALALKLAQGSLLAEQGTKPVVYLVDDVFGELDQTRRAALMSSIPRGAQQFYTTTTVHWDLPEVPLEMITVQTS